MAKSVKNTVWIVVNKNGVPYVDYRFTKKHMTQHHCDSFGYIKWQQARNVGDRVIKANLTFNKTKP